MPLGMYHALFEVAVEALQKTEGLGKPDALSHTIGSNAFQTTVGTIDFRKGPFPNTSRTPLVLGQWWKGDKFPLTPLVESNALYPDIPLQAKLRPLTS